MNKKIAFVTGVSRLKGLGYAICENLAKKGNDIFFTYWTNYDKQMPWGIKENEPIKIQEKITQLGVKCYKKELDLRNFSEITSLFDDVEKLLGIPSILINNATYSTQTKIENINSDELDNHYDVNLKAVVFLIQEFVKRFRSGNGSIINISSGQSLGPMNNEIAYAMTKSAIENLTVALSHQLAERGITINAVNPGLTDTGWLTNKLRTEFSPRFPKGRIGMPTDAAKLITFLASDEAS